MQLRAVVAAASLMLALGASAEGPAPGAPPAGQPVQGHQGQQGLIVPGRSPELEILFTGDVVGFLEPCG